MFPHRLNDARAFGIAQAMLDGFNPHGSMDGCASGAGDMCSP
jgi:hypothetical protein